jgi:hypothetical protein
VENLWDKYRVMLDELQREKVDVETNLTRLAAKLGYA